MTKTKRGRAYVCGTCWYLLRPDQYEPYYYTWDDKTCALCGGFGNHRVSWAEVDQYWAEVTPEKALEETGRDTQPVTTAL